MFISVSQNTMKIAKLTPMVVRTNIPPCWFCSPWVAASAKETAHGLLFRDFSDGLRCKSWGPVLSLRQGTARTSKAYRTSHKPYWALHSKSRINYTIVFGCREIENVLKYWDFIVF